MKTKIIILIALALEWIFAASTYAQISVDDDGPADFSTIQAAINDPGTINGSVIIVQPGLYLENIDFGGKNIVLTSVNPQDPKVIAETIINADQAGPVVSFLGTEDPSCHLSGFTIQNGFSDQFFGLNGHGIEGNNSTATIVRCLIINNFSDTNGGGLANCQGSIISSIVRGNVALDMFGGGGGFYNCNGDITNCLIYNNQTVGQGGAMMGCSGRIFNCTLTLNQADSDGGGMFNCMGDITNCIIWENESPMNPQIAFSSIPTYSCIQNWFGGGLGNIIHDPLFVGPTGFDGLISTPDDKFALRLDSPCIDAGANDAFGLADISSDLDSGWRFVNQPSVINTGFGIRNIVDMGALEKQIEFSLELLDMNDQSEFDNRVTKDPDVGNYIRRIVQADLNVNDPEIPDGANGVMEMRTKIAEDPNFPTLPSVTAKAHFCPTVADELTISFQWLFINADPNVTQLAIYFCEPNIISPHLRELARIKPPEPEFPGGTESGQFVSFRGTFKRGNMDFSKGTYILLELSGSVIWIDNWNVQISGCPLVCGDYSGDDVTTFKDYLFLLAGYGLASDDPAATCMDVLKDGYIDIGDIVNWDEDGSLCGLSSAPVQTSMQIAAPSLTLPAGPNSVSSGELLIAAKSSKDGLRSDMVYRIDSAGTCLSAATPACPASEPECKQLNGRLIINGQSIVHQINALSGIYRQDTGAYILEPQAGLDHPGDPGGSVQVGIVSSQGLPISDAVFHPCDSNSIYVVPVLVQPGNGCFFQAAAKIDITGGPSNYSVSRIYGADPNSYSTTTVSDCSNLVDFLYQPHRQNLSEIEIDPAGQFVYVSSTRITNNNNYIMIYREQTGLEAYNLTDPNQHRLIAAPTAMSLYNQNGQDILALATSITQPIDLAQNNLTATLNRYRIDKTNPNFPRPILQNQIEILFADPNQAICEAKPSLCGQTSRAIAAITSMTYVPGEATLYVVGMTAPAFESIPEDRSGSAPAIFANTDPIYTTPILAVITPQDANQVTAINLGGCDPNYPLRMPVSILWSDNTRAPGDITGDGSVDLYDFAKLALYWLSSLNIPPCVDLASVGGPATIDPLDLKALTESWLE